MNKYVVISLETHLFFGRIMKEHALFLMASFPSVETDYIKQSDLYREQFEKVLEEAVQLADGNVREGVLCSGEVVTEYTKRAEHQTQKLTGIPICMEITEAQERLQSGCRDDISREKMQQVRNLNQKVIHLLNGLITLKENILNEVTSCNLYTSNYPLLIEHITREARWYRQSIMDLENGRMPNMKGKSAEMFWNRIMMEHAQFIRGFLDPTECELMNSADEYAKDYCELLKMANQQDCRLSHELTHKTMETTEQYRDFKAAGTQGITECNVRSVILPLLADHVLREANHYLRLLEDMDKMME